MYDYRDEVLADVLAYIRDEYTTEALALALYTDRCSFETELNDALFTDDSVTGNASGSYYCNAWKAEEALAHNWDLLADALEEFGCDTDILRQGPEACDVTIRCYLLPEAIAAALDEIEDDADIQTAIEKLEGEEAG